MEAKTELKARWKQLLSQQPKLRIRNAAQELGVSELQLLLCQEEGVTRLGSDFRAVLNEIPRLDRVMALTRNEDCVIERKGTYANPQLEGTPVGLFLGKDIDLRLFFSHWAEVVAAEQESAHGIRRSIQFFTKDGMAAHKVYLTEDSNLDAFNELVLKFKDSAEAPVQIEPSPKPRQERPDEEIDPTDFQKGWVELKDTHDFFMLMGKHGLTRTQALRFAPSGNYAEKVENDTVRHVMEEASKREIPIMIFVGNRACLEIHSGRIHKLMDARGWFNVLDADLNVHLKDTAIKQSWVVRKPSEDGTITSLECFNEKGEMIIQLFGARKPGIPQLPEWTKLMDESSSIKLIN